MSHLNRGGVSVRNLRRGKRRLAAQVAIFLLLVAGVAVGAPGVKFASATSSKPAGQDRGNSNDDHGKSNDDHGEGNANGHDPDKCQHPNSHPNNGQHRGHHYGWKPCTTTATLTLNKIVINDNDGTSAVADFTLTATSTAGGVDVINGPDLDADSDVGITADVPAPASYVLSESGPGGYDASNWECSSGDLVGATLTLAAGDVATCTLTNDDTAPQPPETGTITLVKEVTNSWGGTMQPADFQLTIDNGSVPQGVAQTVPGGTHVISEVPTEGYAQTDVVCTDTATGADVADVDGSIEVGLGQDVACTVFNADIAPTLTVVKHVTPDVVPTAAPESFQLTIDDQDVPQNAPQDKMVGAHTVGEVAVAGYRLTAINCTLDGTDTAVDYTGGVTLALDQHVTCVVTNQHDPIDLAITKTVSDTPQIAGGAAFDYTITVDNLGPRDTTVDDSVVVTDQLPEGFNYVAFPDTCTAALRTLTCTVAATDLEVSDLPVVLIITVNVSPETARGVWKNIAYVDTPGDPACLGDDCVPDCDSESNNVACATVVVLRESSILVTKVDDVESPVVPGDSYAYDITVTNAGPSSLQPNLTLTDALPADVVLETIDSESPWTCTPDSTVVCIYGAALARGESAPVIRLHVHIVDTSTLDSVTNVVQVTALVEPGNVVTGTASEVTPVAETAELSIEGSSASTTPEVVGSALVVSRRRRLPTA